MPYTHAFCVCLICMPHMYATYVCLICTSYTGFGQYALHVCRTRMPYMYASYVCLICMPRMYASYVPATRASGSMPCKTSLSMLLSSSRHKFSKVSALVCLLCHVAVCSLLRICASLREASKSSSLRWLPSFAGGIFRIF